MDRKITYLSGGKMKNRRIGILTLPLRENYGGILQAVALYTLLEQMGHQVYLLQRVEYVPLRRKIVVGIFGRSSLLCELGEFALSRVPQEVWIRHALRSTLDAARIIRETASYHKFWKAVIKFRSRKVHDSRGLKSEIERLGIETVVVGSDQVWRLDYAPGGNPLDFMLEFLPEKGVKKISYAASFGHADWRDSTYTDRASKCIQRFDAISVRELSGINICRAVFKREDVSHVLDPTLLLGDEFYKKLSESIGDKPSHNAVVAYVLDKNEYTEGIIAKTVQIIGAESELRMLGISANKNISNYNKTNSVSIEDWIKTILGAKFVITDSFHGMVFSIIFKKNFMVIVNESRGADRFYSILNQLALLDRIVKSQEIHEINRLVSEMINYEEVEKILDVLRNRSRSFLEGAV